MKAIEYHSYGSPEVLQVQEVPAPIPADNEILVRIKATSVTTTEAMFRSGHKTITRLFTGIIKPRFNRLGEELAGEIVQIGKDVNLYKVGDEVFGTAGPDFSANAEFICLPEDAVIAHKPSNLTFEEAAASVDGFLTAMPFLRDHGHIAPGQKVLIIGASGSIGTSAVQISQYFGAEVTAVCSGRNTGLVKDLGASYVIDYTQTDFTQTNEQFDIIMDAVGITTFSQCEHLLTSNGRFLEVGMSSTVIFDAMLTSIKGGKKAKFAATGLRDPKLRIADLQLLSELLKTGEFQPVLDRIYPLDEIVQAHEYVETGHKRGNVAISVA